MGPLMTKTLLAAAIIVIVAVFVVAYALFGHPDNPSATPSPSVMDNFVNAMVPQNITAVASGNYYGNFSAAVNAANGNYTAFPAQVQLHSLDPTVYKELLRNNSNQTEMVAASKKFLDLGLYGKVNVLDPSTGAYVPQAVTVPTVQAASNCSAYECRTRTALSRVGYFNLLNATQIDKTIVDFSPITLHGTDGTDFEVKSQSIERDHYMIGRLLEKRSEIVSQPNKYEWTNRMMQQMSWNIFDNPYGPGSFDNKTYTPTDDAVWQVITSFHDYLDKLPGNLQRDAIEQPIAFNDAPALRHQIADYTNRMVALLNLAQVHPLNDG